MSKAPNERSRIGTYEILAQSALLRAARIWRAWATRPPRMRIVAAIGAGFLLPVAVWLLSSPHGDDSTTTGPSKIEEASPQPRAHAPLPPSVPPTSRPPSTATPLPPTPPVVATLQLKVSATPAEARFFLDGIPLNGNPAIMRHAVDNKLHVLRAVGSGLRSQHRVIAFDRDHDVTFELPRVRDAVETQVRLVPRETSRNATPATETATAAALPPRSAPALDEIEYDAVLTRKQRARPIEEEDPYR